MPAPLLVLAIYILGGIGYAYAATPSLLRLVHERYGLRPEFIPRRALLAGILAMGICWPITLPCAIASTTIFWGRRRMAVFRYRQNLRRTLREHDLVVCVRKPGPPPHDLDLLVVRNVARDRFEGTLMAVSPRPIEDLQQFQKMTLQDLSWLDAPDHTMVERRDLDTITSVIPFEPCPFPSCPACAPSD